MSGAPKDGGQAFPAAPRVHAGYSDEPGRGMSLRDHFAAQALVGIVTNEECGPFECTFRPDRAAMLAYRLADAMIQAREKEAVDPDLLTAAKFVLLHLEGRIDAAPSNCKPVFPGIADLHDAIAKAEARS